MPTYDKRNAILQGPALVSLRKGHAGVEDLLKTLKNGVEFRVGLRMTQMRDEEARKLVEAIQAASRNHVYELIGRERNSRRLDSARPVLETADKH